MNLFELGIAKQFQIQCHLRNSNKYVYSSFLSLCLENFSFWIPVAKETKEILDLTKLNAAGTWLISVVSWKTQYENRCSPFSLSLPAAQEPTSSSDLILPGVTGTGAFSDIYALVLTSLYKPDSYGTWGPCIMIMLD